MPLINQRHLILRSALLSTLLLGCLTVSFHVPAAENSAAAVAPTDATASESDRLVPNPQEERIAVLAKVQSPETEVLWLETPREAFLGLMLPANRPSADGGALLIPHEHTHPDWPDAINPLRSGLPDLGWHSLAIAVPDAISLDKIIARMEEPANPESASANSSTTVSDQQGPDLEEQVFERMNTAIAILQQRESPRILVIGVGTGAYWAARFTEANESQLPLVLLMIDAEQLAGRSTSDFLEPLSEIETRVMDLYSGSGLSRSATERWAKMRRDIMIRKGRTRYQQVRMPIANANWKQDNDRLLNSVRGLLRRYLEDASEKSDTAIKEKAPGKPPQAPLRADRTTS